MLAAGLAGGGALTVPVFHHWTPRCPPSITFLIVLVLQNMVSGGGWISHMAQGTGTPALIGGALFPQPIS